MQFVRSYGRRVFPFDFSAIKYAELRRPANGTVSCVMGGLGLSALTIVVRSISGDINCLRFFCFQQVDLYDDLQSVAHTTRAVFFPSSLVWGQMALANVLPNQTFFYLISSAWVSIGTG